MRVAGFPRSRDQNLYPILAPSTRGLVMLSCNENCASDVNVLLITLVRFSAYNSTDQASFVTPQDTS